MENKKNYVFKISDEDSVRLKTLLQERSWEFAELPYAFFKASKPGVNVVSYQSGKLVVQGAEASDFVEFILEPEILKEKAFDAMLNRAVSAPEKEDSPFDPHAGIDESGKGDFFGPLVIACAYVPDAGKAKILAEGGIKDSKLIKSDLVMEKTASLIRNTLKDCYAIVAIGPEAYNRIYEQSGNLNRLLAWGHAQALESLLQKRPDCRRAISDQFADEHLVNNAFGRFHHENFKLEQFTKAESDVAVAAASILARAEFVRRVKILEEKLGMKLPKGASTLVDAAAKQIALTGGETLMRTVAKMHFRTAYRALGLPEPEKKEWRRS